MDTDCSRRQLQFQGFGNLRRQVVANFDGGTLSSDGGVVLLGEVERRRKIVDRFAACLIDHRDPSSVEHSVRDLVAQRVYGLALGYEDVNDHDELRADPLLATVVGKRDPVGSNRIRSRDVGKPLAGKSTLNRLEAAMAVDPAQDRYKRFSIDPDAVDRFFVDAFVDGHDEAPEEIILDLDATDDPLHGQQEGRFFHGYYGCYCYLPLYIFCGQHLLCARLRQSGIDASAGAVDELRRIVDQIRESWPDVEITVRADSGFARDELMSWCEDNDVHYVLGLARNSRLQAAIASELDQARRVSERTDGPHRIFKNFSYRTLDSWSRSRRVVGKAEHLPGRSNPRFVVTSLSGNEVPAAELYEDLYCARGDMENRIKEQQLGLFADRTSSHWFAANQLRLWLSSVAYVLMSELRRLGLRGTALARAQCDTIRLKLLKIGAHVRVTCRRVWVKLSSAYPRQQEFAQVYERLAQVRAAPG